MAEKAHTTVTQSPIVRLDAPAKVNRDHHIVSVAVIVAIGDYCDGRREVMAMTIDTCEADADIARPMRRLFAWAGEPS